MTAKTSSEDPAPSGWGPTSRRVAANLVRLRQARGLSTKRLSEALDEIGQPIPATGITRIEKGQRRVDTDDLVALALALNVSPLTLLLPPTSGDQRISLTENHQVASRTAWQWGEGQRAASDFEPDPVHEVTLTAGDDSPEQKFWRQQMAYEVLARPEARRRADSHPAIRVVRQLWDRIADLVAPEPGADRSGLAAIQRTARRRYEQLGIELDEIDEQLNPPPIDHPGMPTNGEQEGDQS